jgi:hypothetical protein
VSGRHAGVSWQFAAIALLASLAAGCASTSRKVAPPLLDGEATPPGFPSSVRIVNDTRRAFEARAPQILAQVHAAAGNGPINILALSGGGVGAAFGAGAVVGWTRMGDRPEFQIVTGVSAGALIAPFAFLGVGWDEQLVDIFSGARTRFLLQPHWMSALFRSSVYRGKPLFDLVDHYVTANVLTAVAQESAKGRRLLVATTDLDKEQTVIWNLGVIAAQGGEYARRLFRDVIVASASIPGLFPPVMIRVAQSGALYDEMHVDGGTTAALFIAPEIASLLPVGSDLLDGANVYIIVNGQFGARTETTPMKTIPILKRSVTASLQSGSLAAVEIALSLAQRNGMRLRVSEIPNDYPYLGPLDVQPSGMRALFEYGVRCAREGQLWATPMGLLDRVELARRAPVGMEPECPGPAPMRTD